MIRAASRGLVRRARAAVKAMLHPALAPLAIREFRKRAARCPDLAAAMTMAEAFEFVRIRVTPVQVRSEIVPFLESLAARPPRVVLEIGTADGGTLFLMTRVAAPDALFLSVDLPGGPFGGGYPPWKARLYRSFARAGQSIELMSADSHAASTLDAVKRLLGGRSVDLLFIDGDHSYEGVRSDFTSYAPLVRPGGIIAFHDIVPGPQTGGVPRLWRELKERPGGRRVTAEHVADWGQGGYGIGVLTVDAEAPSFQPTRESAPLGAG